MSPVPDAIDLFSKTVRLMNEMDLRKLLILVLDAAKGKGIDLMPAPTSQVLPIPSRGKSWAPFWLRRLEGFDPSKTSGYAFEGSYVKPRALGSQPEGSFLIAGWKEDNGGRFARTHYAVLETRRGSRAELGPMPFIVEGVAEVEDFAEIDPRIAGRPGIEKAWTFAAKHFGK